MFPVLLQIGPVTITTHGILLAIGFFFASFIIWQKGREEHFQETKLMDCIIIATLSSLLFSRIYFILLNLDKFSNTWKTFDLVVQPGFSWQGALIGGLISLIIYTHVQKWDFFLLADIAVFGIIISLISANLGTFLSSINFNSLSSIIFLVKTIVFIALYFFTHWLALNYRTFKWYKDKRGKANPGFLFFSFLIINSLIHLTADFILNKKIYFSTNTAVNVIIIIASIFTILIISGKGIDIKFNALKKRHKKPNKGRFKTGMEAK